MIITSFDYYPEERHFDIGKRLDDIKTKDLINLYSHTECVGDLIIPNEIYLQNYSLENWKMILVSRRAKIVVDDDNLTLKENVMVCHDIVDISDDCEDYDERFEYSENVLVPKTIPIEELKKSRIFYNIRVEVIMDFGD